MTMTGNLFPYRHKDLPPVQSMPVFSLILKTAKLEYEVTVDKM